MTKTPHKKAEIIKAWADGETIEFYSNSHNMWLDVPEYPLWTETKEYRVKPKEPITEYVYLSLSRAGVVCDSCPKPWKNGRLKLQFDPDNRRLISVELLK